MKRLATAVTRHPWRVLMVWFVVIAALVTLTSPGGVVQREDVMKSDPASFLPQSYESARAAQLEQRGFPAPDGATATLVVRRADRAPLTAADVREARDLTARAAKTEGVRSVAVAPGGLSENRKVLLGSVLFDSSTFSPGTKADVDALRDRSDALFARTGLVAGYAGDAATTADAQEREGITGSLTMIVIAVLLIALFGSVVIAFFDVMLIGMVGAAATGALVLAAKALGFALSDTVTGLLPIVVLGVGTDYVIFLLHRYREQLRAGDEPRVAMRRAITHVGPAIGFSALAVVVALSALALSSMESFRVLGPALGFSVLATLVAALTLVPAVAVLLRGGLFWPRRRQLQRADTRRSTPTQRFVAGKPLGSALAAAAVLIALSVPALGFTPDYDADSTVSGSPSAKAFADLKTGFPQGALEPAKVIVHSEAGGRLTADAMAPLSAALQRTPGVGEVLPAVVSRDGRTARVDTLLSDEPFSSAALGTMEDHIRPAAAAAVPSGTTAAVGGSTSAYADVRTAINKDQRLIFPVAALLVAGILIVLLRSIAVPLVVMAGVILGFLGTLGASVVAFQGIGGHDGLTFQLPLVVYLFVASMTSDYAILILARVREEIARGRTPRDAASVALQTAGPSVLHAGLVLAGSFAVLLISPSLGQIGFAIAAGILLSSLVTARLLIPALTVVIGRSAWWPSRLARQTDEQSADHAPPATPVPEPAR
jgi:putative drug exporter of the RND superfamily